MSFSPAGTARSALGRYRSHRELRWRRLPQFRVHPRQTEPVIYYVVPDVDTPHGGVRVAYRHVDLLNALGYRAAVLHASPGFRVTWFPHATRVEDSTTLRFCENDLLVVPEVYGPSLSSLDPLTRVLIFNQGAYITFDALDLARTGPGAPYREVSRLEGIMTVSQDSADLLGLTFADIPISIARPVIDRRVFHPGPVPTRQAFAFSTTRRPQERNQVLHMMRALDRGWVPVPLSGMTESQVAETLRSVPLFVSFSDRDGFGLPPAEAMASGAHVVGYPGGGGEEYFNPDYCTPVRSTAELVREFRRLTAVPLAELAATGRRASEAVLGRYSEEGLCGDLVHIFAPLCATR